MRSRSVSFDPIPARYVRIGEPSAGPGARVTELALYCSRPESASIKLLPQDPPPSFGDESVERRAWMALAGTPFLTPTQALEIKALLAAIAAALLFFPLASMRAGRARDALLVALGAAASTTCSGQSTLPSSATRTCTTASPPST